MSEWRIGTPEQLWAAATPVGDLGISGIQRTLLASGQGSVSFQVESADALTDDIALTHGNSYVLWRDEARWFYGRVVSSVRESVEGPESATVELADPFWYFKNAVYMQRWKVWDEVGEDLVNINKARVVLFQDEDGDACTTGDQVLDIIAWLAARGAPVQAGTIDAGISLPMDERVNISCQDVLDTVLRWTPDRVAWFDYSTNPPTFNFTAAASLSAASLALGTDEISGLIVTPRHDLQKPGVTLAYELTHQIDGKTYNTVAEDTAGVTTAVDAFYGVFELTGMRASWFRARVETEAFPTANDKAWWKSRIPWLAEIPDADITVHDHALDVAIQGFPRILKEGSLPEWLNVDSAEGHIRAKVDTIIRDDDPVAPREVDEKKDVAVSAAVVATDAETRRYTRLASMETGEPVPVGLAAALFAAWGRLHYEGKVTLSEDELSSSILPGARLNITGGRTAWATMNGIVQQVSEDAQTGETTISFGPLPGVEADTLVGLMRAFRARRVAYQRRARTTAEPVPEPGAGEDDPYASLGGPAPRYDSSEGGGVPKRSLYTGHNDAEDLDHEIDVNPASVVHAVSGDRAARVISPREIHSIEESSGSFVARKRQAMVSDAYGDSTPIGGGCAENPGTNVDTIPAAGAVEGGETALTDTWTSSPTGNGLALWVVSRVVYNEAGDQKLYKYFRKLTFDKCGRLWSVSGETRVIVDTPVSMAAACDSYVEAT